MIETGVTVLRLLLGLGAIFCLGYALLTLLVPRPRDFTCLERAAFSFGVGALALTLWMLALTWWGVPFGLGMDFRSAPGPGRRPAPGPPGPPGRPGG